jgi:hypothetical protein
MLKVTIPYLRYTASTGVSRTGSLVIDSGKKLSFHFVATIPKEAVEDYANVTQGGVQLVQQQLALAEYLLTAIMQGASDGGAIIAANRYQVAVGNGTEAGTTNTVVAAADDGSLKVIRPGAALSVNHPLIRGMNGMKPLVDTVYGEPTAISE